MAKGIPQNHVEVEATPTKKPEVIKVEGEVFEIVALSEVEKAHRLNELSKKKKKLDFDNIPLDDKKTWKLISSGLTKGIFQLEKQLGKRYCKEIKPNNINELSDVVSLIRPGCLTAEFREKPEAPGEFSSITNTYIKIKHGEWEPEYIHPCLEPILSGTNSVPIYQEQLMRICTDFSGFTLKEADVARKAIGKKKKDVMAKVKINFLEGAEKNGHPKELADTIFGWIEKFSEYGFNKSHAISYALIAYKTAYAKTHYPLEFFRAMLTNSGGKQDSMEEIQELVYEARLFHLDVKPPSLKLSNADFAKGDDKTILFGLAHIKGVGAGAIGDIRKASKVVDTAYDFIRYSYGLMENKAKGRFKKLRSNICESLIKSGALDYLDSKRIRLLAEYKLVGILTERERKFIFEKLDNDEATTIRDAYKLLIASKIPNKARLPRILEQAEEVNRDLSGTPKKMRIAYEKHLLGIPLSGSLVELYENPEVSIKCRDFHRIREGTKGSIGVVIEGIRTIKDKNGNHMAFLTVSDETYMLDSVVVFASFYNKLAWILKEGIPVLISGKKNRGGLVVHNIRHL
jgi:DNA polymerase-3 subunit alpha